MDAIYQTSDGTPAQLPVPGFDRTPLINPAAGNGAIVLPGVPVWGQLTEWTPTSAETPEARMNCGPMCASIVIKALTGIAVPSVYNHDLIHGPDVVEGTTLQQLHWLLTTIHEIPCELLTVSNAGELLSASSAQIAMGHPYIELMYFDTPGTDVLHFRVGFGHDPYENMMVDPWFASIVKYGHERHFLMSYKGLLLINKPVKGFTH